MSREVSRFLNAKVWVGCIAVTAFAVMLVLFYGALMSYSEPWSRPVAIGMCLAGIAAIVASLWQFRADTGGLLLFVIAAALILGSLYPGLELWNSP